MNSACATNEGLAGRATEIDAGSPGQSLLRHGDAVSSRRRGHGSHQPGRPAAQNHDVVIAAFSVGPVRWMALAYRLLIVNVVGKQFHGGHRTSSSEFVSDQRRRRALVAVRLDKLKTRSCTFSVRPPWFAFRVWKLAFLVLSACILRAPRSYEAWRNERNAARSSALKSSGCSQAAKWPPLSTSLK